mgnify:CR=1 FL=1
MVEIKWDAEAAEKGGYEHFMLKEIHEQPKAVEDTLNSVLQDGSLNLEEMGFTEEIINNISCIYINLYRTIQSRNFVSFYCLIENFQRRIIRIAYIYRIRTFINRKQCFSCIIIICDSIT